MIIKQNEVHLWLTSIANVHERTLDSYINILSATEQEKLNQLQLPKQRCQFLVSTAVLRLVLSKYVPQIKPGDWEFNRNEHGKPYIANQNSHCSLQFNLSHSKDLIALAIANTAIGVDVENISRPIDPLPLAKRYFTVDEYNLIRKLSKNAQRNKFLQIWTLKEAYVKACGKGLAHLLNKINFIIHNDDTITATFSEELNSNSTKWQFKIVQPDEQHLVALAVASSAEINLSIHKIIPDSMS